jgi:hypothetical protein
MVLLKLDEPFFSADGASYKRFTNVHLPMVTLRRWLPASMTWLAASWRRAERCRWQWITATFC